MKNMRNIIILLGACVILGFILSRQFLLQKKLETETTQQQEQELAIEVSTLIKSNKELDLEKIKLRDQYNQIHQSTEDKKTAMSTLKNSIEQYKIIAGQVPASGQGVIINFDDVLDTAQLTDLVNALRNIGVEALSINGKRITPTTGWDMKNYSTPYKILAIGDSHMLKEALTRPGGIMENIGFTGNVTEEKKLYLPAAK